MAIGLGVLAVGLAYKGYKENKKASKAAGQALEEQRKQARLANLAQRRAEARKAIRERAAMRAAAASSGASNSSGFIGGMNTATQTGNMRVSFLDTMNRLDTNKFNFQKSAASHASKARAYESASAFSMQLGSAIGSAASSSAGG